MGALLLKLLIAVCALCGAIAAGRIKDNLNARADLIRGERSDSQRMHEVIFAVKLQNIESLRKTVDDISNMRSPNYGKYLSRSQISDLTANPVVTAKLLSVVDSFVGAKVVHHSRDGRYIHVEAPIGVWEKVFDTEFYSFSRMTGDGEVDMVLDRAESYVIPHLLREDINAVFNTVQMPPLSKNGRKSIMKGNYGVKVTSKNTPPLPIMAGSVTPDLINSFYSIPNNDGGGFGSQSLYESLGQTYSPEDLAGFQENFEIALYPVASDIGGHNVSAVCVADANNCTEANLDVQYIMAVAQQVPTIYFYDDTEEDFLLTWAEELLAMDNPPLINSISYGAGESYLDFAYANEFDTSAVLLSAMGVTIFASSGDDGVNSFLARYGSEYCGYDPSFPATSPYVTAVGATQGPESDLPEVACTSDGGGIITSGGGFSTLYAQPSWQSDAIEASYFNQVAITGMQPAAGFNVSGRGYPDLSTMGYNYNILNGDEWMLVSGTSASSPVMAGFFALINAARIAAGNATLGWINPSLYTYTGFYNDITSGENNCAASGNITESLVCCEQGFWALEGWDPVTGFGSVNYDELYKVFGPDGDFNPPTLAPTSSPDSKNKGIEPGILAVAVVGGVVGASAIGAAAYYSFGSKSSLEQPILDSTTKSPMT